jgi:hypothetical protein
MKGNDGEFRDERNRDKDHGDGDLRARFRALRREEEAQAPDFLLPTRSADGTSRRWAGGNLVAVAACLATIVAVAFLLRLYSPRMERQARSPVASVTEWKAPTDFLLQTPGQELLRTMPAIGEWRGYSGGPRPSKKHSQTRKTILP